MFSKRRKNPADNRLSAGFEVRAGLLTGCAGGERVWLPRYRGYPPALMREREGLSRVVRHLLIGDWRSSRCPADHGPNRSVVNPVRPARRDCRKRIENRRRPTGWDNHLNGYRSRLALRIASRARAFYGTYRVSCYPSRGVIQRRWDGPERSSKGRSDGA